MEEILNKSQIECFINEGFIKIENAFSGSIAEQVREILWNDLPCDPADPGTWTQPVIRLGMYTQDPFIQSANTDVLLSLFDQLVGKGKWTPVRSMGTFPVRFPSQKDPGDTGWHVDASFPGDDPGNYFEWRINVRSRGRGLLMLFLYSDVTEIDAPTRIRKGSHADIARILHPKGDRGMAFMEVASELDSLPVREEVLATGRAGDVYLCHPFLVHAAMPHSGTNPKFMAQPPLILKDQLVIEDGNVSYSPVEEAIRQALKF